MDTGHEGYSLRNKIGDAKFTFLKRDFTLKGGLIKVLKTYRSYNKENVNIILRINNQDRRNSGFKLENLGSRKT